MEPARTDWSDWRLDSFSESTKRSHGRLEEEVRDLRRELADVRAAEWKRRYRNYEIFYGVCLAIFIAAMIASAAFEA